jgi:Family of unknown function (DUF6328)
VSHQLPTMRDQGSDRAIVDDPGRNETEEERDDRNLVELVQELRVGALGVQVLFGFLLSLPFFAAHFERLSRSQRNLYVVDLLLAALATALLSGPVAYHRLVFRRHRKRRLLRIANIFAVAGLALVGLDISGSVLLAISYVEHGIIVPTVAVITFLIFAFLWFVMPLAGRREPNR